MSMLASMSSSLSVPPRAEPGVVESLSGETQTKKSMETTSGTLHQPQRPASVEPSSVGTVYCYRLSGEIAEYPVDSFLIKTVCDFKVYLSSLEAIPVSLLSLLPAKAARSKRESNAENDERDEVDRLESAEPRKDNVALGELTSTSSSSSSGSDGEEELDVAADDSLLFPRLGLSAACNSLDVSRKQLLVLASSTEATSSSSVCALRDPYKTTSQESVASANEDRIAWFRLMVKCVKFEDRVNRDLTYLDSLGIDTCRHWVYLEAYKEHTLWKELENKSAFLCRICKQHRELANVILSLAESPKLIEYVQKETGVRVSNFEVLPEKYVSSPTSPVPDVVVSGREDVDVQQNAEGDSFAKKNGELPGPANVSRLGNMCSEFAMLGVASTEDTSAAPANRNETMELQDDKEHEGISHDDNISKNKQSLLSPSLTARARRDTTFPIHVNRSRMKPGTSKTYDFSVLPRVSPSPPPRRSCSASKAKHHVHSKTTSPKIEPELACKEKHSNSINKEPKERRTTCLPRSSTSSAYAITLLDTQSITQDKSAKAKASSSSSSSAKPAVKHDGQGSLSGLSLPFGSTSSSRRERRNSKERSISTPVASQNPTRLDLQDLHLVIEEQRARNEGAACLLPEERRSQRPLVLLPDTSFDHLFTGFGEKPTRTNRGRRSRQGKKSQTNALEHQGVNLNKNAEVDADRADEEMPGRWSASNTGRLRGSGNLDAGQSNPYMEVLSQRGQEDDIGDSFFNEHRRIELAANEKTAPPRRESSHGDCEAPLQTLSNDRLESVYQADSSASGISDFENEANTQRVPVFDSTCCRVTGFTPLLRSPEAVLGEQGAVRSQETKTGTGGSATEIQIYVKGRKRELATRAHRVTNESNKVEPVFTNKKLICRAPEGEQTCESETTPENESLAEEGDSHTCDDTELEENACYDPHVYSYYTYKYSKQTTRDTALDAEASASATASKKETSVGPSNSESVQEPSTLATSSSLVGTQEIVAEGKPDIELLETPARIMEANHEAMSRQHLHHSASDTELVAEERSCAMTTSSGAGDADVLSLSWPDSLADASQLPPRPLLYTVFSESENALYSRTCWEASAPSRLPRNADEPSVSTSIKKKREGKSDVQTRFRSPQPKSGSDSQAPRPAPEKHRKSPAAGRALWPSSLAKFPQVPRDEGTAIENSEEAHSADVEVGGELRPRWINRPPTGYRSFDRERRRKYRSPNFGGIFMRKRRAASISIDADLLPPSVRETNARTHLLLIGAAGSKNIFQRHDHGAGGAPSGKRARQLNEGVRDSNETLHGLSKKAWERYHSSASEADEQTYATSRHRGKKPLLKRVGSHQGSKQDMLSAHGKKGSFTGASGSSLSQKQRGKLAATNAATIKRYTYDHEPFEDEQEQTALYDTELELYGSTSLPLDHADATTAFPSTSSSLPRGKSFGSASPHKMSASASKLALAMENEPSPKIRSRKFTDENDEGYVVSTFGDPSRTDSPTLQDTLQETNIVPRQYGPLTLSEYLALFSSSEDTSPSASADPPTTYPSSSDISSCAASVRTQGPMSPHCTIVAGFDRSTWSTPERGTSALSLVSSEAATTKMLSSNDSIAATGGAQAGEQEEDERVPEPNLSDVISSVSDARAAVASSAVTTFSRTPDEDICQKQESVQEPAEASEPLPTEEDHEECRSAPETPEIEEQYVLKHDLLNYVDETGRTALMWLLVWKHEQAARAVIKRADFVRLNQRDKWGGFLLTLAVPTHSLFLEIVRRRSGSLGLEAINDVLRSGFPAFRLAVKLGLAEKREHILRQQERILLLLRDRRLREQEEEGAQEGRVHKKVHEQHALAVEKVCI
ncbi:unnamed protein product [Amoebophrya sp. A25]|nr:unnamed protein product [Amoebophrya sp. A25]|eukprot:GSA25T00017582001.1